MQFSYVKGEFIPPEEVPEDLRSVIDNPLNYYWVYPCNEGYKVHKSVIIELYGFTMVLSFPSNE